MELVDRAGDRHPELAGAGLVVVRCASCTATPTCCAGGPSTGDGSRRRLGGAAEPMTVRALPGDAGPARRGRHRTGRFGGTGLPLGLRPTAPGAARRHPSGVRGSRPSDGGSRGPHGREPLRTRDSPGRPPKPLDRDPLAAASDVHRGRRLMGGSDPATAITVRGVTSSPCDRVRRPRLLISKSVDASGPPCGCCVRRSPSRSVGRRAGAEDPRTAMGLRHGTSARAAGRRLQPGGDRARRQPGRSRNRPAQFGVRSRCAASASTMSLPG